jgi:hypothetical protein
VRYRRRSRVLLLTVLAALGLTACGSARHPYDATAENNGFYVKGSRVEYQLQVSRVLNPFLVEDHQYLTGLPAGTAAPAPNEIWYGVFLWAQNLTHSPQATANSFDIVDTQGNRYYPVPLNSTANEYAWTSQTLLPQATEPGADTTAAAGPTGGGLLLFKLPTSVYANRPLTLDIYVPGRSQPSTISLDL